MRAFAAIGITLAREGRQEMECKSFVFFSEVCGMCFGFSWWVVWRVTMWWGGVWKETTWRREKREGGSVLDAWTNLPLLSLLLLKKSLYTKKNHSLKRRRTLYIHLLSPSRRQCEDNRYKCSSSFEVTRYFSVHLFFLFFFKKLHDLSVFSDRLRCVRLM